MAGLQFFSPVLHHSNHENPKRSRPFVILNLCCGELGPYSGAIDLLCDVRAVLPGYLMHATDHQDVSSHQDFLDHPYLPEPRPSKEVSERPPRGEENS